MRRIASDTRRPTNKGFTLLEVLLAVALLSFGSIFLLQSISMALFASGETEQEVVAASLAQEKMELEMNAGYANVLQESPSAPVTGFSQYNREVLVTTPQTSLKQVTVNVSWDVKGATQTISLVGYVSDI